MSEVLDRLIIGGARVTDKGRLDFPNLYSQLDNILGGLSGGIIQCSPAK